MIVLCGKHFVLDLTNVPTHEVSEALQLAGVTRTCACVVMRVTSGQAYSMGCFVPPPGLFESDSTPIVVHAEY